ncbi:PREDICTED: alpha-1-antitrypsin-like [Gavialis gangeticus]|uniref:alpha-1-antitrypsin-like n=1 Tax=Gavialis gangeticus TaxID=94835 RepID=UPI00092FBAC6|nr:PREDICTED: alpha-1-antitrypsin-like [Gavialis gangeticus]
MKPFIFWCLVLVGLYAVANCHHISGKHKDEKELLEHSGAYDIINQGCPTLGSSYADFTFSFYKQVMLQEPNKNIFFSPISISTAFAMLAVGAKSTTLNQIFVGMGFNLTEVQVEDIHEGFHHLLYMLNKPDNEIEISLGNALFTDRGFRPLEKFLNDIKAFYEAEFLSSNFHNPLEAKKQINDYVEKKTHGKIQNFLARLDPRTVMVLVNYIYFKASWENPFAPIQTTEADFFVDVKTPIKVNMMRQEGEYASYYDKQLFCEVVQIPYHGTAEAILILPDNGKMKEVENVLVKETVCKWRKSLKTRRINLHLPRVSVTGSYDIQQLFEKMGITEVFSSNADLSGINGAHNLQVTKAIHKALLKVHENGTEAAAATAIIISKVHQPSVTIKFNRPFIMLIVDKASATMLFMGKIVNPTGN